MAYRPILHSTHYRLNHRKSANVKLTISTEFTSLALRILLLCSITSGPTTISIWRAQMKKSSFKIWNLKFKMNVHTLRIITISMGRGRSARLCPSDRISWTYTHARWTRMWFSKGGRNQRVASPRSSRRAVWVPRAQCLASNTNQRVYKEGLPSTSMIRQYADVRSVLKWGEEQKRSFDELKTTMCSAPGIGQFWRDVIV